MPDIGKGILYDDVGLPSASSTVERHSWEGLRLVSPLRPRDVKANKFATRVTPPSHRKKKGNRPDSREKAHTMKWLRHGALFPVDEYRRRRPEIIKTLVTENVS